VHPAEPDLLAVEDAQEAADVDRVALDLLRAGLALPGAIRVGVALSRGAGRELQFTASDRDNESVVGVDWCTIDGMADVPLTQAVRTGSPIHMPDVAALFEHYPLIADRQVGLGTRALAAYPLVDAGTVHGGVLLSFDTPQTFDADERAGLEALASRTAAALTSAHVRSRVIALAGHGRGPSLLPTPTGVELGQHHGVDRAGPPGGLRFGTGWVEVVELDDGTVVLAAGHGSDDDPDRVDTARQALRDATAAGPADRLDPVDPVAVLGRLDGVLAGGRDDPWAVPSPVRPGAAVAVLDSARRRLRVASTAGPTVVVGDPAEVRLLPLSANRPLEVDLSPGSVVVLVSHASADPLALAPAVEEGARDVVDPLLLALRLGPVVSGVAGVAEPSALVARLPSGGTSRVTVDLPDDPTAPRLARRTVATQLDCWGASDLMEAAQACVSELCTNALIHSATGARLVMSVDDRRAVVLVQNGGTGQIRRVEPDDDGVGGRGLLLVEALSTDWGWASGAEGTTVWFELDRE
jgi:hypothetical protein